MNHSQEDTAEFDLQTKPKKPTTEHFLPSPSPVRVEIGGASHRGKIRPTNQDHFAVVRRHRTRDLLLTNLPANALPPADDEAYALVVADGMGGRAAGDLASRLALQIAWDLGGQEIKWTLKLSEQEIEELKKKAEIFFQLINRKLTEYAQDHPEFAGMGTTLTVAYTVGPAAFIIHAGDSRAYLLRTGQLFRLTHDHTLEQHLRKMERANSDRKPSSYRHVLTNCIGSPEENFHVDIEHFSLLDGDTLLLCTDGLTEHLSDQEIGRIVLENSNPQTACDRLLELALDRGGRDNVTVVGARYSLPGSTTGV